MSKLNWQKSKRQQQMRKQSYETKLQKAFEMELASARAGKTPVRTLTPELRTDTITITPQMATKWLEGNTHNRPLRNRDVELFATAMENGQWCLNGESIIFDNTGRLLDGQHRLWACVESNTTFESVVVTGADPEVFTTIDQGRHRSAGDHIFVTGIKTGYRTHVAAAASLIIRHRTNQLFASMRMPGQAIVDLCKNEPDLVWWVEEACRTQSVKGFATPISATLYMGSLGYREKALAFMRQWKTGEGLQSGSPVLALRQRLLSGNTPFRLADRFYMAVQAWNAFATGRSMLKVQSMRSDKFPRVAGED